MMQTQTIITEQESALAWITINRPAARNALTVPMWSELATIIERFNGDDTIRVIIITGMGEKSFISGADIQELQATQQNPSTHVTHPDFTTPVLAAITRASKPVIAMINGHCIGGGLLIATACDLRFASEQALFSIPAVKLGLAYPIATGVLRLTRLIGASHAADILLSGRTFDAIEANQMGLLNRIASAATLRQLTRDYALQLAANAPLSLKAHKIALQDALCAHHAAPSDAALAALAHCYQSSDQHEGLTAFLAKRPPVFQGK